MNPQKMTNILIEELKVRVPHGLAENGVLDFCSIAMVPSPQPEIVVLCLFALGCVQRLKGIFVAVPIAKARTYTRGANAQR